MFRYNLKLAWRRLRKDRLFSILNLVGLSAGLASALLIYLWVNDERSVDGYLKNKDRLYKVMSNMKTAQDIQTFEITPVPLSDALLKDMPEIEHAVSVNDFFNFPGKEGIISANNKALEAKGWHAGKDFFNVFSFDLIEGNKDHALSDENNIVLSETLAKKLFGTTDHLLGKTIQWKHPFYAGVFKVSGVFKDPPANATAKLDFLLNIKILLQNEHNADKWTGAYAETYLILKKGTNVESFNKKIAGYLQAKGWKNFTLFTQQYSAKYLYGNYENGVAVNGRSAYTKLFSMVALFILLIACINFMNLSTAQASGKIKEVGVKKAIGAARSALIVQFLAEAVLMALLSLIIAIGLIFLLLPQFNSITGKYIELQNNYGFIAPVLVITLVTGFISGCYPAFYLSGFNPVAVLKGKLKTSLGELWVRKGLVVVQFAITVIFITGFLIIREQIKYTQNKNLGYNKDNVLCFTWKGELYNQWNGLAEGKSNAKFDAFMQQLKNAPGVESATNILGNILTRIPAQSGVSWTGQESEKNFLFQSPVVGLDFLQTLGIQLKEGRAFSTAFHDDYSKIILNEKAVALMKLKDPVGKKIDMNGDKNEIVGVVKDFHYGSLHNSIEPVILRFDPTGASVMVKMKSGSLQSTIAQVQKIYNEYLPGYAFDFTFLDADYQAQYNSELRVAALSTYFSVFAMLISSLGLFGLAAFTAQKRQKEISIRKILGAKISNLSLLLSADFIKLVFISIIIAIPISWLTINKWLQSFSEKLTLNIWFFVAPALMVLLVSLVVVSFHVVKAAVRSPVGSLRGE